MNKDRSIELKEGKGFFRRKIVFLEDRTDNTNGK